MIDDLSGQSLEHYHIEHRIGQGGMAEVYLAKDTKENRQVAIKIPKKRYSGHTNYSNYLYNEARILEKLWHKNILNIYELKNYKDTYYIVMPYAIGGSLEAKLGKNSVLSSEEVLNIIEPLLKAVSYIHDQGIIHRDIKPDNILFDSKDTLKLSDFGIRKILITGGQHIEAIPTALSTPDEGMGSPQYMAPEQAKGDATPQSDIYSIGVILYRILTGNLPFTGNDGISLQYQHAHVPPKPLREINPNISPKLEEVVLRTLEKDHTKRYQSANDLLQALKQSMHPQTKKTVRLPNSNRGTVAKPSVSILSRLLISGLILGLILGLIPFFISDLNSKDSLIPLCSHILTVTTPQDNTSGSLRQMVNQAQNGDCIKFDASIKDNIILTNKLDIKHDIIIQGNQLFPQKIQPLNAVQNDNSVSPTITNDTNKNTNISVFPNTHVTFINLSFKGSDTYLNNSLISNQSQELNIISCSFHSFHSYHTGSVISNLQGNLTLKNSYLKDNSSQADGGGAIYNEEGTLTLDHSTVTSNSANYSGGGIYNIRGNVYLQEQSSLDNNRIVIQDTDLRGEGGGGIISRGGMIAISNSIITQNNALGDGGGILLIDASAQITSSTVKFNSTSLKDEDIAVEADPNEQPSHLFIDQPSSSQISGVPDQEDPRMISSLPLITQSTAYNPTNNPQFLGTLTTEQFRAYCQQLKSKSFTDVILGTDEKSIQCISDGNGTSTSFFNLKIHVTDVCTSIYPNKEHILARLASYWSPSSWQCFENEQKKDQSITKDLAPSGKTWLDTYCQKHYGTNASLLNPQSGYEWKCTTNGSSLHRINMSEACREAYGDYAVDFLATFSDPYSWFCWVPISVTGTPTPTTSPTPMPTSA